MQLCLATRTMTIGVCLLFAIATTDSLSAEDAAPWAHWRGPQSNNTSTATGLIDQWDPDGGEGSNILWKREDLGSRSTPIVFGGRLYTIVRDLPATPQESEKVVCVDAKTGKVIWEHRINIYLCEVPDTRVGWSCCGGDPETGRVYVQSVCGYFCCLEGDTGKIVWERSLLEEFGLINTYGGRTNVPIVFEDLVITSAVVVGWGDSPKYDFLAKPAHRFMAFDKSTGEIRWMNGTRISPYDTTYSTPSLCVLGGQAAMVFGSGDGQVWAMQPRTGKHLWHYPFSRRGINTSPLVVGDTVFSGHSEENIVGNTMGAVVALDGTMTGNLAGKEKWIRPQLMVGKTSPVMVDGMLCVVDDRAKMYLLDPETGKQIAKKGLGTAMRSTPLVADGKIYTCTNNGRWYVLQVDGKKVKVLHKERLKGEASDGSPIAAEGRIYLPTSAALYCLAESDSAVATNPLPAPVEESPVAQDTTPAQLQVIPYDVLLEPGETVDYKLRVFNSRGQLLQDVPLAKAEFSVDGVGQISSAGQYQAPESSEHETALVKVQLGELSGTARIRIVPPLPWSFDFEQGDKVPLTWIGGRVRYVVRDVEGNKVAVKRSVLPTPRNPSNKLGTRSQLSMGHTELANYTIQGDFSAQENGGKMPDYGLTNSRYSMTVRSSTGELRLYSWSPHDFRTYASVKIQPKAGKWYTMKLRVDPGEDQSTVRGKLWPRDEQEPQEWTIEMVDDLPHQHGSPGLFGKSEVGEIYIDNVKVYAND